MTRSGRTAPDKPRKVRLDVALVERGLAQSREKAQAMVLAGDVELSGSKVAGRPTAGMFVATDTEIIVRRGPRFVSRGGEKLAHALAAFNVDPSGMVALDIGASTGGFTDCLLQAGARKVYAVDVGRGQLHAVLAADRRVVSMERLNARNSFQLPEPVDLVVVDVSFISLRLVLGPSLAHVTHGGKAIVLVKPQFEAEPEEVGRKGVITDPGVHAAVIGRVVRWCVERGIRVRRLTASPILGDEGNREFLLLLQPEPV